MTNTEKNFAYDAIHNTTARKLRYMPYAQAHWDITEWHDGTSTWTLTSYSSRILTVQLDSHRYVNSISTRSAQAAINYSRTTSRQVTMALRELGLSDHMIAAVKKILTNCNLDCSIVSIDWGTGVYAKDGTCKGKYVYNF